MIILNLNEKYPNFMESMYTKHSGEILDDSYLNLELRVNANKLMDGWTVPMASVDWYLDVTKLVDFLEKLKKTPDFEGIKVTLNNAFLKIIGKALEKAYVLNAHFFWKKRKETGRLIKYKDVNIAMPFVTKDKLTINPVLLAANKKSFKEICIEMMDMRRKVNNTNVPILMQRLSTVDTINLAKRGHIFKVLRRLKNSFFGKSKIRYIPTKERKAYDAKFPKTDRITQENVLSATTLVSNIGAITDTDIRIGIVNVLNPMTSSWGISIMRDVPKIIMKDGVPNIKIKKVIPVKLCLDHRVGIFADGLSMIQEFEFYLKRPKAILK